MPSRVSTLAIAVALVAGPSPALAQSLQGTGTFTYGSGSIGTTTGGTPAENTTTINVDTSQAVIDWTPFDNNVGNFGAIAFQYEGTTATFQSGSDFAVLNRINVADSTRILAIDGIINSLVGESIGGAVYFYSPSGIVIGPHAVINVGSLVLTARPITVDPDTGFINNGVVEFGVAADPFGNTINPDAAINTVSDINGTAQINATGAGSYVALVAPTILHQGDIRTDGAAALVAAEAATITFSPDGLFNVQVTTGTDVATGIHIDGGTIGRNDPTEGIYNHRAYLVAVAKNDAVTMLINNGGSVGFDTATTAQNGENNSVILSGGYDISAGDHWITSGVSQVDLTITNATLSSSVDAQVTGGAAINSSEGALSFGGDLSIIGGETTTSGGNVLIDGMNGNALTIAGNLYARAFRRNGDGSQTGLITRLGAESGSTVTVGGDVELDSDSFGASAEGDGLNGTNATGGNAQVNIGANSTLNVTGSVDVHADGYGGDNFFSNGAGGNGIGGQAFLMSINGGADVNIGGSVFVSAQGFGGSAGECSACNITGGSGVGGFATVHTNGGSGNTMDIAGDVSIISSGYGGAGDAAAGGGFGGLASLGAANSSTLTIAADTQVDATGFGGYGFDTTTGGLGLGGEARIGTDTSGSIDLDGPVFVISDGYGGDGANGGTGTGGRAYINAFNGTIHAFNSVDVTANSYGGAVSFGSGTGGAGQADTETVTTPDITEASLKADGGTLTIDGLTVVAATATGGDGGFEGGSGGSATAGAVTIFAADSSVATSTIQLGNVIALADADGGFGANGQGGTDGQDGGDGGSATAGMILVAASAGSGDLTAGATLLSASATGGTGGSGGGGDGGSGGNGGDGGSAVGGATTVGTISGNAAVQPANNGSAFYTTILAFTTATGGDGGDGGFGSPDGIAGNGGDAFGGNSLLMARGSEVTVGDVLLDASAFGGNGGLSPTATDGDGGDATAGRFGVLVTNRANLPLQRGTLFANNITGQAAANGGIGGTGNGQSLTTGGNQFSVLNSDATINSVSLVTTADAFDSGSPNASPSYIEVQNGTVDVAGAFTFQTPGSVAMWADNATLNAAQIIVDADNFIHDDTVPAPTTLGTFNANNIFLTTGQDLIVDGHLASLNGVGFTAPGLIDFDNVTSTNGPLSLDAGSTITAGNLSAGDLVAAFAGGDISVGNVNAGGAQAILDSTNGAISAGAINAATFIGLNAPLGISTGNLDAGDFIFGQSDGSILTGNATAGTSIELFSSAGGVITGDLDAGTEIDLDADGDINFGDATADDLDFSSSGAVTGGNIIAGTFAGGDAGGAVALGDINVGIQRAGGPSEQGFAVGIASETSISVGNVDADEAIGFATLGDLTTGSLNAGTDVMTLIGGNTTIASITTPGTGRTYHGDVQMFLDAGGPDDFDPSLVFGATPLQSGGFYTVTGPISTGSLQAAAASISTGAINANDFVWLAAGGNIVTGPINALSYIEMVSGGGITTDDLDSGDHIDLLAAGDIAIAAATTGHYFDIETSGGGIIVGDVTSGDAIEIAAGGGDIDAGNLSAGIVNPFPNGEYHVALVATNGSVTVDSATALDDVYLVASDGLTAGAIDSGGRLLGLAGIDMSFGAIATSAQGRIHLGNYSMTPLGGDIGSGSYNVEAVFNADPVPTGGSITINGPVSTGLLQAAAGTSFTAGAIMANQIDVSAGGLATINGLWQSPDVELWSDDIDIAVSGGIDGGAGGTIRLVSTNATQALIGDGLSGPGYALSNAEFGRLSAGNVQIAARGDASAAIDMLIGDLSVTGPLVGSTIEDSDGALVFATGDPETQVAGGVIRITGNLVATGFADTNAIEFYTGWFELDAATGLLEITSNGTDLSGEIYVEADRVHVASGTILDQLASNPQYAGYQEDLNAPADVQRPDGVIRAGGIDVFPTEAVLVQNTGTAQTPAGFLTFADGPLFSQSEAPPGPIELIINGQLITENGQLTGVDVRDFLIDGTNIGIFTENSTINGCALSGPCGLFSEDPNFTPTPGIQDEVTLFLDDPLPPPDFGNEDFIDDNNEETDEGATSPITPPDPLFDTSQLGDSGGTTAPDANTSMRSNSGLTEPGDVDDPVSGSGNPALMETPPPPTNEEKQP
jgi:filamentous hemagglutinin family protein